MRSLSCFPEVVIDFEKLRHINTGLGQFSLNLGREILKIRPDSFAPAFLMPRDSHRFFSDDNYRHIPVGLWKKEGLRKLLRPFEKFRSHQSSIAAWHITHQSSKYLPFNSKTPVLLTIHDLNFLQDNHEMATEGSLTARQNRKLAAVQRLVNRASVISTVSHFTEGEVRKFLQTDGKPIYVIPNGLAQPEAASPTRPTFVSPGEYYLTVGNCLRHKNFHVLIKMISEIPQSRLVIAGKKQTSYGAQLQKEIIRLGLENRIFMTGEVSQGDLQWLYENCEAFFFPSLAEGFGFPVLEAMQCGKPVFMARSTSLPEIAGQCGFFFDSFEPEHMANICCEGLRTFRMNSMKEQCQEHARTFSWERAAKAYINIYKSLLRLPL